MNRELIGELVFKSVDAQILALIAWAKLPNVVVENVRGVIRVYKNLEVTC